MSERTQLALQELARLSSREEAFAVVEAMQKKRKELHFAKYWEPYEAQKPILKLFTKDIKIFGILGGNRSGKTEMGAFIATAWALGKDYFKDEPAWDFVKDLPIPDPPNNIWVVGLDFATLRDVIWFEKLRVGRNHPPLLPKDENAYKKIVDSSFQVFLENGSIITGKSADSGREKFQGASVDLVWIDEEPEVEIYDECYQRTSDCAGKILVTLTPLTDTASGVREPWVFNLFDKARTGKTDMKFTQLSVLDNPYVPQVEKDKLIEKWAGHFEEKARLYGGFIQRSGLVYDMWNRDKHLITPYRVSKGSFKIVSIDPAATGTTAVVWASIDTEGNITLYREYYERDMVISEHAKSILLRCEGEPIDVWLIDPKWGTQRNAETHKTNLQLYRDAGIPARLAPVDSDYGIQASKEYMYASTFPNSRHPKLKVFNSMHNFIHEVEHYVWDSFTKGPLRGLSKDKPSKRNDHLMNAYQYLAALRPRGRRHSAPLNLEEARIAAKYSSYT